MSLISVGTMAFDAIETPFGKTEKIIGGSAIYVAYAAAYFVKPIQQISIIGSDFPQEELDELKEAIADKDITAVADALSDIQYVLSGAILEFGLGSKFKDLFEEVQRSNMSKVCADVQTAEETLQYYLDRDGTKGYIHESDSGFLVYRESDKKVLKSVKYSPADLEKILAED